MKRFFLFSFVLLLFFFASCGKKVPLNLNAYQKPAPPSRLTGKEMDGLLSLSWSYPEDKNLAGFIIERRSKNGQFKTIAELKDVDRTYIDAVEPGMAYLYHVRAKNLKGILSDAADLRVPAVMVPPPPTGLAFKIGENSVTINWTLEAALYNIYRKIEENKDAKPVLLSPAPQMENYFTDSPWPANTVTYEVSSVIVNSIVFESSTSDITIEPTDYIPQKASKPEYVFTPNGVALVWEPNPEKWLSGYMIYKKTGPEFKRIGKSAVPSFLDVNGGHAPAEYRVSAFSDGAEGPASDVLSVPAAPVLR